MRKWKRTSGLLFWAAASVYPVGTLLAGQATSGKNTGQEVRLLEETAGPVTQVDTNPKGDGKQGTSASAPQVNVSDAGTVEIHVNEANLVEVLRMLTSTT